MCDNVCTKNNSLYILSMVNKSIGILTVTVIYHLNLHYRWASHPVMFPLYATFPTKSECKVWWCADSINPTCTVEWWNSKVFNT